MSIPHLLCVVAGQVALVHFPSVLYCFVLNRKVQTRKIKFNVIIKKMQLDVDIEPIFRFTYMECTDGQKDITMRQTDRHTDSGDLSPTRTCVPYVLLATV